MIAAVSAVPSQSVENSGASGQSGSHSRTHTHTHTLHKRLYTSAGDVKEQTVQSPPPDLSTVSSNVIYTCCVMSCPSIINYKLKAALEVQMKAEQQSTEGIAGILTTIEQQQGIYRPLVNIVHVRTNCSVHSTELAGEIDQLPRPPGTCTT